jgi:hypothetical protein
MMSDFETSKDTLTQQQLATSLFKRTGGPNLSGFRAESWADAVEANRVLSHITNS